VDKEGRKTWEQRIAKGECKHRASLHQPSSKGTRRSGATQKGGVKFDGPQCKAQLGDEGTERQDFSKREETEGGDTREEARGETKMRRVRWKLPIKIKIH